MDRVAVDWQEQNKTRLLEWRKRYYQKNRDNEIASAKAWNAANPEGYKRNTSSHYNKRREQAMMAYGGYLCSCCGETEPMFLSIDHVNNDQCDFAKKFGRPHTGLFLFTWLLKNGYPPGFQVLCHNCNQGKRINGGVCPHQVNKA